MTGLLVRKDGNNAEFINFDYVAKVNVINGHLVAFSEPKDANVKVSIAEFNEYYKNDQWKAISTLEELSNLLNNN